MYKIVIFIPEESKEELKSAMFAAGAGQFRNYDCCCFESKGRGQFRPSAKANPFIGQKEKLEYVDEYRIEMICQDKFVKEVMQAMKKAHPYEEPAYDLIKLINPEEI